MDGLLAVIAGLISTAFTVDLALAYRRRPRPHTAAYAVGMGMFAVATWALAFGLTFGWNGASYRAFFLFGAILNIPYLALGSMYLVVGTRAGTVMFIIVGAISAISVTLTTTVDFAAALPAGGIPHDIFPPISDGFGPRLLAAIGGGTGATVIIVLSVVSIFRFWKSNRRLVTGNILITAGTLAAGGGGTGLAIGESAAFALSLLVAAALIWAGYRLATGARRDMAPSGA